MISHRGVCRSVAGFAPIVLLVGGCTKHVNRIQGEVISVERRPPNTAWAGEYYHIRIVPDLASSSPYFVDAFHELDRGILPNLSGDGQTIDFDVGSVPPNVIIQHSVAVCDYHWSGWTFVDPAERC